MSPHTPEPDPRSDRTLDRPSIGRRALRRLGRATEDVRAALNGLVDGLTAPAPSLAPAVVPVADARRARRGGGR